MPSLSEYRKMPQYDMELWAFEYRIGRYLEGCSDIELHSRSTFLRKNISMLAGGIMDSIPKHVPFQSSWWWFKMLEHTKMEMDIRKISYQDDEICDINYPCLNNIIFSSRTNGPSLIRYSSKKWIKDFLLNGKFRLTNSQQYIGDDSPARKDDENKKRFYTCGRHVTVTHEKTGMKIPINGNLTTTLESDIYYLLCFSSDLDIRVAREFCNEDCGIIAIFDPEEFNRRLFKNIQQVYGPVNGDTINVVYYDPWSSSSKRAAITPLMKDFSFNYQREIRTVVLPKIGNPINRDFLHVDIGNIEDIAKGFILENGRLKPLEP